MLGTDRHVALRSERSIGPVTPRTDVELEVGRGSGILSLFYRTKDLSEAGTRRLLTSETLAAFSRLTRFHESPRGRDRDRVRCLPVGVTVKPVLVDS